MTHQFFRPLVAAGILAALIAGAAAPAEAQEGMRYAITFTSTWTPKTHPLEYPEAGLLSGPHFSGLIGASHNRGYHLFQEGTKPTPGLERLSEEGKHSPLDEEIGAAITAGQAGMLFESGPIKNATAGMATTEAVVTDRFPMVSAVAMIAPSPDWFCGVENVSLKEDGRWVQTKTVELYAWDSGGDDGSTYKASDVDTDPKKPTTMAKTPHFVIDGKARPVATLTFTLMK